jgi:hypothetical protein
MINIGLAKIQNLNKHVGYLIVYYLTPHFRKFPLYGDITVAEVDLPILGLCSGSLGTWDLTFCALI